MQDLSALRTKRKEKSPLLVAEDSYCSQLTDSDSHEFGKRTRNSS